MRLSKNNSYIRYVKMFKNETVLFANLTIKIAPAFKKWLLASGKDDFAKDDSWPEEMHKLLEYN